MCVSLTHQVKMESWVDTDQESAVGTLEQRCEQRQKRLQQLKQDTLARMHAMEQGDGRQRDVKLPRPKFRTYNPNDDQLKKDKLPKVQPESIEDHIEEQLKALKDNSVVNDVDLTTLAPRKIDWDLKRNIEGKLKKLDKRTEKAINELLYARLNRSLEQQQ